MSEPARDPDLDAFVQAIETAFRTRRGKEHVLHPRDFALARGLHEASVSLATVLVAIDAAFEHDPRTASLAACRRRIEELAAPSAGQAPRDGERVSLPEVSERLDSLRERLHRLDALVETAAVEALSPDEAEALRAEAARAAERHQGKVDEHALLEVQAGG